MPVWAGRKAKSVRDVIAFCMLLALPWLSGCGSLLVSLGLMKDTADVKRTAPAEQDLPDTATIALTELSGRPEDAMTVGAALGEALTESGRFQLVERERLEELRRANNCASASDLKCLTQAMPASAVVFGRVSPLHYRENVKTETYDCERDKRKTKCFSRQRIGEAAGSADLRLVDVASGKVLCQKLITRQAHASSSIAYDDDAPEPIDSMALLESLRRGMALEFFEAISPHTTIERIALESESALPELGRGNDFLKQGDVPHAVSMYQAAVERAGQPGDLDAEGVARAHYGLAVGLVASEKFPDALASLKKALALNPDDDWKRLALAIQLWEQDAARVARQLAFAQASDAPVVAQNVP